MDEETIVGGRQVAKTHPDEELVGGQPMYYWMARREEREDILARRAKSGGAEYVRDASRDGLAPDGTAPKKESAPRKPVLGARMKRRAEERAAEILAARKNGKAPAPTVAEALAEAPARKRAARQPRDPNAPKSSMRVPDAAAQVLADAGGGPLTLAEIVTQAQAKGYWIPGGKTPEATMSSAIYTDNKKLGPKARFLKIEKGYELVK